MNPAGNAPVLSRVSVILPALDEELTIGSCIKKIHAVFLENSIQGEILVADASTDRTAEIARSLGAIVIHPEKNGYGNAYLFAFEHAHGQYIVMGDADDTYDFLEIPKLLLPLKNGADFVIGSRFKGPCTGISATRFLHGWSTRSSIPGSPIPTAVFVQSQKKP
jgi:glycosyltransferase involved in cell wall biosynthesis